MRIILLTTTSSNTYIASSIMILKTIHAGVGFGSGTETTLGLVLGLGPRPHWGWFGSGTKTTLGLVLGSGIETMRMTSFIIQSLMRG